MLKNILRYSGYLMLITAFLILFFATIIFVAYRQGTNQANAEATTVFERDTSRQLELVQTNIAEGNLEYAAERLDWLQQRIPDDETFINLQASVTALSVTPMLPQVTRSLPTPQIVSIGGIATHTPTPVTTSQLTPSPTSVRRQATEPTSIPTPENIHATLRKVENAIDDSKWEDAISELISFQLAHPDYERFYTDSLLFSAYVGAGFQYTNSNRVTIGINYFEEAEKLGELPEDAVSQLYFSRSFLTARAYYGINWPLSIQRLSEICTLAPLFQDSCDLLFNAYVAYGDQLAEADQSCPAIEQYQLALRHGRSPNLADKIKQADWKCENATPTPWSASPKATTVTP